MFQMFNANPINRHVGDCTVRAISKVLSQPWDETYIGIFFEGYRLCDMPSANAVWGSYLRSKGFCRNLISDDYLESYSVKDFCKDHPEGTFLLSLSSHVVAVIDGIYYDTWDSGDELVLYYWYRKEE